jgi:hypothetical protein
LYISELIEDKYNKEKQLFKEGWLRFHQKICLNLNCACNENVGNLKVAVVSSQYYLILEILIKEQLKTWPKNADLHLIYGFFNFNHLNNKLKALGELMICETLKQGVSEVFQ